MQIKKSLKGFSVLAAVAATTLALQGCAAPVEEVEFPTGPINYVIPYNPGGSTDPAGREFARLLAIELGTTETVENIPGGDETIGVTAVLTAEPDGHSLGVSSATGIIVQPLVNPALPFKGPDDYTPVGKMIQAPNAIFVGKDSPFQTIEEFIAAAKERPGEISVGTTGRLTNNSFAIYALEEQAGIDLNLVPFQGGAGEAVLAAIGGQIDAVIPTVPAQLGLFASGDIRALAHTGTSDYNKILGGAPSFEELGYDIPFSSDYVTIAAKGLPEAVKNRLVDAAYKVASSKEWADWCAEKGFLATPMKDQELLDWIEMVTEASKAAIAKADAAG